MVSQKNTSRTVLGKESDSGITSANECGKQETATKINIGSKT